MHQIFKLGTTDTGSDGTEGTEYRTVTDGHQSKIKVLNIDSEIYAPKSGIVEIEPLKVPKNEKGAYRHIPDVAWSHIRDKSTGYIVGIPQSIDPETKQIIWRSWNVKGKETYDLSIPEQRAKWIMVKYSHFYIDSPNFVRVGKMMYKANDREKEAVNYQLETRRRRKATTIVDALIGGELEEMAYMIGINPKSMSDSQLHMEVSKFVENPVKISDGKYINKTGADIFMELYESETRVELGILKRGLSSGILRQTIESGIAYEGLSLGFSEPEALKFLRDNPATRTSIDLRSRKTQDDSVKSMTPSNKTLDEKDAKIIALQKELEEANSRAKQATSEVLEAKSISKIADEDPEFADILERGKKLKSGFHLIGRTLPLEERKTKLKQELEKLEASIKN